MSSEATIILPIELVYVLFAGMIATLLFFVRIELRTRSQALDIGAIKKCITGIEGRLGIVSEEVEVAKEGLADHEGDIKVLKDRTAGMRKTAV